MNSRQISALAILSVLAALLGVTLPALAAPIRVLPGTAIVLHSGQPADGTEGLLHKVSSHKGTLSQSKTSHSHRHHEHHHVK